MLLWALKLENSQQEISLKKNTPVRLNADEMPLFLLRQTNLKANITAVVQFGM